MSINEVMLEHSHAHLFMNCLCAFVLRQQKGWEVAVEMAVLLSQSLLRALQIAVMRLQFDSFTSSYWDILKDYQYLPK